MTRVAVVDLGTNSTRLLVADVENGLPREVERERLRPASWSNYGSPASAAPTAPRGDASLALSTGDSVRHASLGEGVVTALEPGGVVTIRFAEDGSERRLMVEYAPLEKIV